MPDPQSDFTKRKNDLLKPGAGSSSWINVYNSVLTRENLRNANTNSVKYAKCYRLSDS